MPKPHSIKDFLAFLDTRFGAILHDMEALKEEGAAFLKTVEEPDMTDSDDSINYHRTHVAISLMHRTIAALEMARHAAQSTPEGNARIRAIGQSIE